MCSRAISVRLSSPTSCNASNSTGGGDRTEPLLKIAMGSIMFSSSRILPGQPFALFYPIIMPIALLCGFGPALFATILSGASASPYCRGQVCSQYVGAPMPSLRSAELIANLSFHEIPGIKTVRIRRTSFVLRSATAFGNVSFRRTTFRYCHLSTGSAIWGKAVSQRFAS
jgi:hypothetical protein